MSMKYATKIKHVVLDVLKPHNPNVMELASALASISPDYRVRIDVQAVDEKTETVVIDIEAEDADYDVIAQSIASLGGSVHSIDQVVVHGSE